MKFERCERENILPQKRKVREAFDLSNNRFRPRSSDEDRQTIARLSFALLQVCRVPSFADERRRARNRRSAA